MEASFKKMWQTTNPKHICAIHGDSHLGNTFITPSGEPGFIDWQGLSIGSAFHDVAYFVSGSLSISDRREHEGDLVNHYLTSLRALGGPQIETTEAWYEYRKHTLQGFAWAIAAPQMQPKDVVFAMAERHATAIADHGSLGLLESLP
jgi:aminoglycoside phosphotransferase (APT) family kinase protein